MEPRDPSAALAFLEASRGYLVREYPAKIDRALAVVTADDVWWRPTPGSNSIGHLIRHLAGNVRQWVGHGIGGSPDLRDRSAEFADRPEPIAPLRERLAAATSEADEVLAKLAPDELLAPRSIQGFETTVLEAVYHVVEHFSMHTGQILWIAKARADVDLGFYDVDDTGRVIGTDW